MCQPQHWRERGAPAHSEVPPSCSSSVSSRHLTSPCTLGQQELGDRHAFVLSPCNADSGWPPYTQLLSNNPWAAVRCQVRSRFSERPIAVMPCVLVFAVSDDPSPLLGLECQDDCSVQVGPALPTTVWRAVTAVHQVWTLRSFLESQS